MKLKIKEGFWQVSEYDLSVQTDALILLPAEGSGQGKITIPFSELRQFSLMGSRDGPESFYMETSQRTYEGKFTEKNDADELVEILSRRGYRVETNLVSEK